MKIVDISALGLLIPGISFGAAYSIDWYKIAGRRRREHRAASMPSAAPSASTMPAAR